MAKIVKAKVGEPRRPKIPAVEAERFYDVYSAPDGKWRFHYQYADEQDAKEDEGCLVASGVPAVIVTVPLPAIPASPAGAAGKE